MVTWGYILEMPGRPKKDEQRKILTALGVDLSRNGPWWSDRLDKAKRHRTAGQTQLEGRNCLIGAAQPGDKVFVADLLCLGVSQGDAEWFLDAIKADVFVQGVAARDVLPGFARALNNFASAKSRGLI